jgi:hypothetical protein
MLTTQKTHYFKFPAKKEGKNSSKHRECLYKSTYLSFANPEILIQFSTLKIAVPFTTANVSVCKHNEFQVEN